MNKQILSIVLLVLSLLISTISSSYYDFTLKEGLKTKKKKSSKKSNEQKKRDEQVKAGLNGKNIAKTPNKDSTLVLGTIDNIIKDSIPENDKVNLIRSFITKQ